MNTNKSSITSISGLSLIAEQDYTTGNYGYAGLYKATGSNPSITTNDSNTRLFMFRIK